MTLLIDTHTFLWFINDSPQLSANAKTKIEAEVNVSLSIASAWEIAIKSSIGKLTIPTSYNKFIPQQLEENAIKILQIKIKHLSVVATLPPHHRDPFDRLIIAQAMVDKVSIVSADVKFDS